MKKLIAFLLVAVMAAAFLAGCGSVTYADGTYTAQSSLYLADEDDEDGDAGNGYGVVTVTIKDGAIADCEFVMYMEDGTVKGETYGMKDGVIANEGYYKRAQVAVAAGPEYAKQLVAAGNVKGVDAISGATISYDQFVEAAKDALKQAQN